MKKTIFSIALATAFAASVYSFRNDRLVVAAEAPRSPTENTAQEIPSTSMEAPAVIPIPDPLTRVERHLAVAEKQYENAEQELAATGFPNVLLDERLSENDRAAIVLKMQKANAFQNQVALLKLKKIDLEADSKL